MNQSLAGLARLLNDDKVGTSKQLLHYTTALVNKYCYPDSKQLLWKHATTNGGNISLEHS